MSESKDNPQLHVQLFEEDLGLPHQWFFSLMNDTDWTFVIKLSALRQNKWGRTTISDTQENVVCP